MRWNTSTTSAAAAAVVAALSGLLSASLLGTASAHHDHHVECFASSHEGFDYEVSGAANTRMHVLAVQQQTELLLLLYLIPSGIIRHQRSSCLALAIRNVTATRAPAGLGVAFVRRPQPATFAVVPEAPTMIEPRTHFGSIG